MNAPLTGVRVLDLSRILAGPWAAQLLADYGADVVKVERPGMGDDTRGWGPPFLKDEAGAETGESAYFACANRGKRSITVDLAVPRGRALLKDLVAASDVLIENFKVGTLARFGLDYASLAAGHPRLVYCSISAFGQDGPLKQAPGYDAMIQAVGGLMSITGVPEHEPGGGPQKVGVAIADLFTGMYAVTAILAALAARAQTGRGQHIDLGLFDCQVAMLANQAMNYLVSGRSPGRLGTAHPNIVPYQAFSTADGHLMLAVGNDEQFRRFVEAAGDAALADDPRYATNTARVRHRDMLIPRLASLLAARPTSAWLAAFGACGVPCGPINDLQAVFAEPQAQHRGLRLELGHSLAGSMPAVANPVRFSATPVAYRRGAPLLGEHTGQVLEEWLGLSREQIEMLQADAAI